jgi:hypothetical protein
MIYLRTPDNYTSAEVPNEEYERLWYYTGALFRLITKMLHATASDREEGLPRLPIVDELITDPYRHSISDISLMEILKSQDPLPLDSSTFLLNFESLPDQPSEIPYHKILHRAEGAIHGLLYFLTVNVPSFYSPGQVVDINYYLDYCSMEERLIGNLETRKAFNAVKEFYASAMAHGGGVIVDDRPVEIEDEDPF